LYVFSSPFRLLRLDIVGPWTWHEYFLLGCLSTLRIKWYFLFEKRWSSYGSIIEGPICALGNRLSMKSFSDWPKILIFILRIFIIDFEAARLGLIIRWTWTHRLMFVELSDKHSVFIDSLVQKSVEVSAHCFRSKTYRLLLFECFRQPFSLDRIVVSWTYLSVASLLKTFYFIFSPSPSQGSLHFHLKFVPVVFQKGLARLSNCLLVQNHSLRDWRCIFLPVSFKFCLFFSFWTAM